MPRVGRQSNRVDERETGHGLQTGRRHARLHAAKGAILELDRDARRPQRRGRVAALGDQDVDLNFVVRVEAERAAADRILHGWAEILDGDSRRPILGALRQTAKQRAELRVRRLTGEMDGHERGSHHDGREGRHNQPAHDARCTHKTTDL